MSKNNKRNSILKKPCNESSPTETFSKADRRISFSRKNSIKEFMAGDDKATIWGTSYEESASSKDTISLSDTPPIIAEPRIIMPTKIPQKNIGMVLRNRKVKIVPTIKNIHAAEEDKENVNILPEIKFHSNDINNSDMDISQEDRAAGVQIENREITKFKENVDSVPIISIEPSFSAEHASILKNEISSLLHSNNSTVNRTPTANWVLNNTVDITLSEYEKKMFLFKDKLNNNKVQLPSPLEKYNELENSQGAGKKIIYQKTPSPLKEHIVQANHQGAIRKVIDRITRTEQEEIKSSLQDDSNEEFFDCMDIPHEIISDTGKNVRKTVYWNETIQDKTELTEKSRIGLKSDKTILVNDEMEIQDKAELTENIRIGSKSNKTKKSHKMLVNDEMELFFSMENKYENHPITLLDISEISNNSHQNHMDVKRKPTILFEKDESFEISMGPTLQRRNQDNNVDLSAVQTMAYPVSNVTKKSEISMELEDTNILKSTPSSTIFNDKTNIIDTEQNAKQQEKTIIYDKEEKLDTLSVTEMKPVRKTILDMSKNLSQFQSEILADSADLGLSILPSVSPSRNSNNMSLSESFMILDSSCHSNEQKNFVNDKTTFSEPINTMSSREFSKTQIQGINKSAIKDRHAILHNFKSEGEVGLHGKRKTIMFQNNDIDLENSTQYHVYINHNESEPKRNTIFSQKNNDMDVINIPQEHHQLAVTADRRGIQKNRQTIMFQENNDLDTTNIINNEYLHSRIQNVSMNHNESGSKHHTISNQKNIDVDGTYIFQDHSQHAVIATDNTGGIRKNRQTIFQKTMEMSIPDTSESCLQRIGKTNNIGNFKPEGEVEVKRQTMIFPNNDIELENLAVSRIQSISINRNQSYPKCHSTFNQKNNDMDVTNISKQHSQHSDIADSRGIQKKRQTIMFQENNELDITNSSNNEYLQNSPPYQNPRIQNKELDSTNNREDQIIQRPVYIDEDENLKSENFLKRKTLFLDENIDIDDISDDHANASHISSGKSVNPNYKSLSHSCFPNQTKNISIDKTSYTEDINTLRPRKFSQNQIQRIDKSAIKKRHAILQKTSCMDLSDYEPSQTENVPDNNDLDNIYKREKYIENHMNKDTIMLPNNNIELENLSQDKPRSLIVNSNKSEQKRHTIFFHENNDLEITNIAEDQRQQHTIPETEEQQQNEIGLQINRQTNLFQNNDIELANLSQYQKESVSINRNESEQKHRTIFYQKHNDMDVTNISQKDPYNQKSVYQNNDIDITKMDQEQEINKNIWKKTSSNKRQTILFQDNNELDTTNIIGTQRKTVIFENKELDLTNIGEDISNKTVNRSITKNGIENLVSNQFLKRKIIFSDQNNDLDLSNVPKKPANDSFDNYDHKPDLVSNRNMEFTNITSQDYAVDINYSQSNISIKLSTPIKNPNNTTIPLEKNPVQTALFTDNDLNNGDLTLNIGMKKMDNTEQSHQNKSHIDFSIVYSPRCFNKKESNIRKKSSENSIRKTINFDCDESPPLSMTASRNSIHLHRRHTANTSKQSLGFTSNCTRHLCRNSSITELTEEQQNVTTVFDKIRKSFGLSLSLDDDIENTKFNLVDDSAITVNGSTTENIINEKYQMNQIPSILNQSNDMKPVLEQSYCKTCKNCQKNIYANESTLHGFTLDNSQEELKLDFTGYDKFQDIPTMEEVMNYHRKKRHERYEWYNSQIDAINAEESFLFPSTPSLKFLYQNITDELYKKAIAETEPDEIEPIFPLIPSVECLLKNKFKNEKLDWKINDLHLPAGILEVRHKSIRTFSLQFLFKKENYAETTEVSIQFDKVLFKECPFYENWTARDLFIHNELSLKIPTNLTPSCSSSPHLFNFLECINKICKNVMLLTRELMLILIDTNASLEKDESNQCFIRKIVRKNLSTSQEIFIRINDSAKLSHANIGLRPGPLCFNDNIQSLPAGLQFVQQFLKEPAKFMKLF